MGQLIYGAWRRRIDVDDRTLAHLRIALRTRMKRGASFQLTWAPGGTANHREFSILIHPGTPLEFRFDDHQEEAVNRFWLRALLRPTLSQDMIVTAEPAPITGVRHAATAAAPSTSGPIDVLL